MNGSEHASIDIQSLTVSLTGKFETLLPISEKRCIYRIPERIRQLNESACSPRAASIGPFHHGREDLKAMEELKLRYLRDFLRRTRARMEDFLVYVKDREVELRECYAESNDLESAKLVEMILVDAGFLIELFLRFHKPRQFGSTPEYMITDLWPDIWKLENQLPMFILKGLFDLAMRATSTEHYEGITMSKLAHFWLRGRVDDFLGKIDEDLLETRISEADHLLDWLRICLKPPELGSQVDETKIWSTPSITELELAGVNFKLGINKHLFDITFRDGILELPKLFIANDTEGLFINLVAFEQLRCDTTYTNDFIHIMCQLVNTRKDEEILIQNGVVEEALWDRGGITGIFHNLQPQSYFCPADFYYFKLVKQLNDHRASRWYRWKTTLKQNYFNTPWASISVIAASILLILTFIQAVCAIIAL